MLKKELDLPIVEISDPNAKLEGGDVLFTGNVNVSQKKIVLYSHIHLLYGYL